MPLPLAPPQHSVGRKMISEIRRTWGRAAVVLAAALVLGLAAHPAAAQSPAAKAAAQAATQTADGSGSATVSVQDLEALANTISNDAQRAELLKQLRALIEVARQNQSGAEAGGVAPSLVSRLSSAATAASRGLVGAVDKLGDLPALGAWISRQFTDAPTRNAWIFALIKLAAMIAIGWIAERVVGMVLTRPRKAVEGRGAQGLLFRLPLLVARTVMDMLPVAAFAVAAYVVLPLLSPSGHTQVMGITFLNAYVVIRAAIIVARMLLVPVVETLRVLPLAGETANYLFIWARRLIYVAGVGYYVAEAALLLGLPRGGYDGFVRLVGLIVAVMVVIFILQNRAPVAQWIQGHASGEGAPHAATRQLRRRLGDVWHVLAVVYILGVYGVWALNVEGGFEYLLRATVVSAIILAAAKAAAVAVRRGVERGFAVSDDVKARFPLLEARVNRYVPLIHVVLRAVITVVAALALLEAWGIDSVGWIDSPIGRRIAGSAFSIGIILIASLVFWEAISTSIERYLTQTDHVGTQIERSARARTLLPLLRNAVMVVLVVLVTLIVLSELGVNIGPLLAGAGVIGLAVGFGSQKLVQDVINGAFILFEDSIAVGDVVTAGGISGVVERLTIRSLRLRDLDGNVHTIPFSTVETVTNMTKVFSMAVIEAGVAYRENVDEVIEVLKQLGEEMRADTEFGPLILEPLDILGVDALGDSAVVIKARFKVRPIKQWAVRREFNRRMKNRFDELGIEIPFPHQTVYFGADKDGSAPPAFVRNLPAERRQKAKAAAKKDGKAEVPATSDEPPPPSDAPPESPG